MTTVRVGLVVHLGRIGDGPRLTAADWARWSACACCACCAWKRAAVAHGDRVAVRSWLPGRPAAGCGRANWGSRPMSITEGRPPLSSCCLALSCICVRLHHFGKLHRSACMCGGSSAEFNPEGDRGQRRDFAALLYPVLFCALVNRFAGLSSSVAAAPRDEETKHCPAVCIRPAAIPTASDRRATIALSRDSSKPRRHIQRYSHNIQPYTHTKHTK